MEDKNLQNTEETNLGNNNSAEKRGFWITSEMIANAQSLAELEHYRDAILAYKAATMKRFKGYEKLTYRQQGFLKYLNTIRRQCHWRIASLSAPIIEAKITTRNERIISCLFMKYAKEELSEEQYNHIYGKALEKVGKHLQSVPSAERCKEEHLE